MLGLKLIHVSKRGQWSHMDSNAKFIVILNFHCPDIKCIWSLFCTCLWPPHLSWNNLRLNCLQHTKHFKYVLRCVNLYTYICLSVIYILIYKVLITICTRLAKLNKPQRRLVFHYIENLRNFSITIAHFYLSNWTFRVVRTHLSLYAYQFFMCD